MSEPTRRPAFGHGKLSPPGPDRPPGPAARPAPPPPPAFEVVEDEPAADFEVVEEAVEVEEARPARRPVRAEPAAETRTSTRSSRAGADDTADDRPRPKKKKKRRQFTQVDDDGQADRDRVLAEFEWYYPAAILFVGVVMCLIGGIGAGGAVGLIQTVGVLVIGLAVSIPLSVAALMVIGILCGIEYGRFGPAMLKLAAITCVANGIMLIGEWRHLPWFVFCPISCLVTLGLFMTQFELDYGEANTSVGAINLFTFLANVVLIGFLAAAGPKSGGDAGEDLKDDGGDGDGKPALVDPGERPKKGQGQGNKRNTRPVDPEDDE